MTEIEKTQEFSKLLEDFISLGVKVLQSSDKEQLTIYFNWSGTDMEIIVKEKG